jgi:hypothetical protein
MTWRIRGWDRASEPTSLVEMTRDVDPARGYSTVRRTLGQQSLMPRIQGPMSHCG